MVSCGSRAWVRYESGWNYNCLDSMVCADAYPKQLSELEERGNSDAYERQLKLIGPLTYMMEHGIRIDRSWNGARIKDQRRLEAE